MSKVRKSLLTEEDSSPTTRNRILDAAEQLFAEMGYTGATLRRITETAQVNLAAVNYHFGGKEELYREVFLRRIRPMNESRLRALAAAEAAQKGGVLTLRTLLDILIRPVATLLDAAGDGVHPFARVMARNLVEPPPFMDAVLAAEFLPLIRRLAPHALRQLPHLDEATLLWRARFIIGAASVTFGRMRLIERRLRELETPTNGETILRQLIAFAEAGLLAPGPPPSPLP